MLEGDEGKNIDDGEKNRGKESPCSEEIEIWNGISICGRPARRGWDAPTVRDIGWVGVSSIARRHVAAVSTYLEFPPGGFHGRSQVDADAGVRLMLTETNIPECAYQ
jgi:hypothetical protein